jgi:hypothetical protein
MLSFLAVTLLGAVGLFVGSAWVFPRWTVLRRLIIVSAIVLAIIIGFVVAWHVIAYADRPGRPVTQDELRRAAEAARASNQKQDSNEQ